LTQERQGKARQGKARQGKARQGKARQGKARQGKARQSGKEMGRKERHARCQGSAPVKLFDVVVPSAPLAVIFSYIIYSVTHASSLSLSVVSSSAIAYKFIHAITHSSIPRLVPLFVHSFVPLFVQTYICSQRSFTLYCPPLVSGAYSPEKLCTYDRLGSQAYHAVRIDCLQTVDWDCGYLSRLYSPSNTF